MRKIIMALYDLIIISIFGFYYYLNIDSFNENITDLIYFIIVFLCFIFAERLYYLYEIHHCTINKRKFIGKIIYKDQSDAYSTTTILSCGSSLVPITNNVSSEHLVIVQYSDNGEIKKIKLDDVHLYYKHEINTNIELIIEEYVRKGMIIKKEIFYSK